MSEVWRLSIRREAIGEAMIDKVAAPALGDQQVRFAIQRFALTANNITYATFGEAMGYWDFFPSGDAGRGVLPAWGFADVVESRAEGVAPGERFFGIWPASSQAILTAASVSETGLYDASAHRVEQASAYLRYQRCAADRGYDPVRERAQMTLQPLYMTSYLLHRYITRENAFGARRLVLTSASSKTAIALAELFQADPMPGVTVCALTSAASRAFVERLSLYDRIVEYDQLDQLDSTVRSVIVDFAGSRQVNTALHTRLQDALAANIRVGGAHWQESAPAADLPGPKPTFFFAPTHLEMERKAEGAAAFHSHMTQAWVRFVGKAALWFDFISQDGPDGCLAIYRALLEGRAPASQAWSVETGEGAGG